MHGPIRSCHRRVELEDKADALSQAARQLVELQQSRRLSLDPMSPARGGRVPSAAPSLPETPAQRRRAAQAQARLAEVLLGATVVYAGAALGLEQRAAEAEAARMRAGEAKAAAMDQLAAARREAAAAEGALQYYEDRSGERGMRRVVVGQCGWSRGAR